MESDTTPTPWQTIEGDRGECWWLDDTAVAYLDEHRNKRTVCVIHGDAREGDAAILAAAPDLLAACVAILQFGIQCNPRCGAESSGLVPCNCGAANTESRIRAAIAKAKGGSP